MATEVQWSELQRDPKSVAALADKGDVRVRRRDGVPLLLVREDTVEAGVQGALAAARALRNVLVHLPEQVAEAVLVEEFPWVELLPAAERVRFASDFVRAVQASAELGRWSVLGQTLAEWKTTAAAWSDPALVAALRGDIEDDFGLVTAPEGD